MANLTEISRKMVQSAFRVKSTADAIALLKESADFRTLKDILLAADTAHSSEEELKKRLVEGLHQHHPEKKVESLTRNVANWFAGRVQTINRDTAFELCLILGLSLDEANRLIMRISEEAIHWRNPREMVWGYAIVHKLSYSETVRLMDAAQERWIKSKPAASASDVFTHLVRSEVLQHLQGSEEELLAFIAENAEKWGSFHNTAYALFEKYMQLLQMATPDPAEYDEQKKRYEEERKAAKGASDAEIKMDALFSIEDILDTYFFRRRIEGCSSASALQRSIRMNWPNESALSKMKTRAGNTDISRKVLVLLFLATNGDASEFQIAEEEEMDEHRTRDRIFRDLYMRLNRMLSRCGFQPLDPRSPFDWMILFCICAEDIWGTDRRLEEVLCALFPESTDDGKEHQPE